MDRCLTSHTTWSLYWVRNQSDFCNKPINLFSAVGTHLNIVAAKKEKKWKEKKKGKKEKRKKGIPSSVPPLHCEKLDTILLRTPRENESFIEIINENGEETLHKVRNKSVPNSWWFPFKVDNVERHSVQLWHRLKSLPPGLSFAPLGSHWQSLPAHCPAAFKCCQRFRLSKQLQTQTARSTKAEKKQANSWNVTLCHLFNQRER